MACHKMFKKPRMWKFSLEYEGILTVSEGYNTDNSGLKLSCAQLLGLGNRLSKCHKIM